MKINSAAFNLFVQNAYETMYTNDDNNTNNNHDTENGDDDDNRGQPPPPPQPSHLVPSLVIYYQTQQINNLRTENIELRTENIELKNFQSIAEITFEHLREEVDNHRNASIAQNTTIDAQEESIQRLQQLVDLNKQLVLIQGKRIGKYHSITFYFTLLTTIILLSTPFMNIELRTENIELKDLLVTIIMLLSAPFIIPQIIGYHTN